jgi:Flp pilus assembly pilin Flp
MLAPTSLLRDRRGASLVEYVLLVGLVAIVALTGFRAFGSAILGKSEAQAACVESFSCGQGEDPGAGSEAITLTTPGPTDGTNGGNDGGNGGDGDGGGFWGGVGDFFSGALDTTKSVATGFFVDGAWGTVKGVWTIVTNPVDTAKGLWTAVTNPVDTWNAIKDGVVTAWNEDPARLIGAGLFEVVTLPVAGLKATKASKLATATKVADKLDDAGDVAKAVDKVDDATDAAKAAENAAEAKKAEEAAAAAAAARRLPHAKPEEIHFSQKSVSDTLSDGTPLKDVVENMRTNGWDYTKPPPDVVRMADGRLVSLDNRRIVAARQAGLDEIPLALHSGADKIPADQAGRFALKKGFTDPDTGKVYPKGTVPDTWEEAIKFRGRNQGGGFPPGGSLDMPEIKPSKGGPAVDD